MDINDLNNQILSPIDSFILEYRSKLLEDRKKLNEKCKKINKNSAQSGTSALKNAMPVSAIKNAKAVSAIKNATTVSAIKNATAVCKVKDATTESASAMKNATLSSPTERPTPTILITDYNKENISQNSNRAKNNVDIELESVFMRNDRKSADDPKTLTRNVLSRDEEKQRFIDQLICSPDIASPRSETDTPRSRHQTPDLSLPVNKRQVDIEKLQNILSESASYVPNTNTVNQFSESFVLASPTQLSSSDLPQSHDDSIDSSVQTFNNEAELFEKYVKQFETSSDSNNASSVSKSQSMSCITPNTFAHDQSCKKIVKIGEFSPLNPQFQPQPSVLNFTVRYEPSKAIIQETSSKEESSCPKKEKRNLNAQMKSKKKSKAVQISGRDGSCDEEDMESDGTNINMESHNILPNIDQKIHAEVRYPHVRSHTRVETCGGGDPLLTLKLKQEMYKIELDKQIEEKRRTEEERKKREQEEDEKAQRAFLEQQERLRREFELEEKSKLQSAMERQLREELLKEKIRQLQIQREEEKSRKRKEKEASQKRQKRELENRNPWSNPVHGNPSSIMVTNPFGNPANSRLDPITSYSKPPPEVSFSKNDTLFASRPEPRYHLSPTRDVTNIRYPPSSRDVSPFRYRSRDTSPLREQHHYIRPLREENGISRHSTTARDVSPIRPPVERFRDVSPVRPLRDTLPESPSLCKEAGDIINAPQELPMPVRRNRHRVTFIAETNSSPPRTRSPSPVLPAVKTHHRMKDESAVNCSTSLVEEAIKCNANRNVLTQLGEFRRQLYLDNLRMNERLKKN